MSSAEDWVRSISRTWENKGLDVLRAMTYDDFKEISDEINSRNVAAADGSSVTPALVLGGFVTTLGAAKLADVPSTVISEAVTLGEMDPEYAGKLTTLLNNPDAMQYTPVSSLGTMITAAEDLIDPVESTTISTEPAVSDTVPDTAIDNQTVDLTGGLTDDDGNVIDQTLAEGAETLDLGGTSVTELNATDVQAFRDFVASVGEMDLNGAWKYTEETTDADGTVHAVGDVINPSSYLGEAAVSTFFEDQVDPTTGEVIPGSGGFSSIDIGDVTTDTSIDTTGLGEVDIDTDVFTDKTESAEGDFSLTEDTEIVPEGLFTDKRNAADITYDDTNFNDLDSNAAFDTAMSRVGEIGDVAKASVNPFETAVNEVAGIRSTEAAQTAAQGFNLGGALESGAAITAIGRAAALPAAEAVAAISKEYSRVFSEAFDQTYTEAEANERFKVDSNIAEQNIILNDVLSQRIAESAYNTNISLEEISQLNAEVAKWQELGANERSQLAANMELAGLISAEERAALDADIAEETLNSNERLKAIDAATATMTADVKIDIANQWAAIQKAGILSAQEIAELDASLRTAEETNDWSEVAATFDMKTREAVTTGDVTKVKLIGQFLMSLGDPAYVVSESDTALDWLTGGAALLDAIIPDSF